MLMSKKKKENKKKKKEKEKKKKEKKKKKENKKKKEIHIKGEHIEKYLKAKKNGEILHIFFY